MSHSYTASEPTYWIAHSRDHVASGFLAEGQSISSGADYFETYGSVRVQSARLSALKNDYEKAVAEWQETLRLRDPVEKLADYRWRRETGGLTLSTGPIIATSRESQSQMTGTVVAMKEGLVAEPVQWKAESGWVPMTLQQMFAASAEVAAHVARCFAAEGMVLADLESDPDLDVEAAFDAAYDKIMAMEPVNINKASAEHIAMRLPGVGEDRAAQIVAGQEWASVDDLTQISGINQTMVDGWKIEPGVKV